MARHTAALWEARKTPVQARSTTTVEAIFGATIQVLLRYGPDRLTMTRVAERAGVSVGTLYHYPNKHSLLFAILERHFDCAIEAVESACEQHHHQPLDAMVEAVVPAFTDAKLERKTFP